MIDRNENENIQKKMTKWVQINVIMAAENLFEFDESGGAMMKLIGQSFLKNG